MSGSKAKQYPPQTGFYAVKVKTGAGWSDFDTARLQISVGQQYHEGDKLKATFNWVGQRFDKVIICVNDTLQRFNYEMDGMSPEDAFNRSEAKGREWIERNIETIRGLPNYTIHRWEDWRSKPEYQNNLDKVYDLYENNPSFRAALDQNISDFWSRQDRPAEEFERFQEISKHYLLEETAVFSMMFDNEEAADIYPGSILLPCTTFQGKHLDGAPQGLNMGHFTRIDFKRNKPSLQAA